jgi:hypothetical protein
VLKFELLLFYIKFLPNEKYSAFFSCLCLITQLYGNDRRSENWNCELQLALGTLNLQMQIEIVDSSFYAYTNDKAVIRSLGRWKGQLAKWTEKKYKAGSLVRVFRGKVIAERNDTSFLKGSLGTAFDNYYIEGYLVKEKELCLKVLNGNYEQRGWLRGTKRMNSKMNYLQLIEQLIHISEEKLYNPSLIKKRKWKKFKKKMLALAPKISDDAELIVAYNNYARKLPFSHYGLSKTDGFQIKTKKEKSVERLEFKDLGNQINYLKVHNFFGTATEVDQVFKQILENNPEHLIIDLRDNPGGSAEAGIQLARYFVNQSYYAGIFLTQKWFNQQKEIPKVEDYTNLPNFNQANFKLIQKGIHEEKGLCLRVDPAEQQFKGKLYILINSKTASTSEPIVYSIKQYNLGLVIGEKTKGAMLNGEAFIAQDSYKLWVPTADYYTADGRKIDGTGVAPDIKVNAEEALEYCIKLIKSSSSE